MKSLRIKIFIITALILGVLGFWYWYLAYGDKTVQLFTAIRENNIIEAQKLIEQGADVNGIRGSKTSTYPLKAAIEQGSPEMVAFLLSKGAKPTAPGLYLESPLDASLAIALHDHSIMSARPRIPWNEVRSNQKKIIPQLVQAHACSGRYPEILRALVSDDMHLVKKLTSATKQDIKEGKLTVDQLERAGVFSGNKELINYVLKQITESNPKIKNGKLLSYAIKNEDPAIIDYVAKLSQTDINGTDAAGKTPLYHALYNSNNINLVKHVLALGANPNIQDESGNTALHYAQRLYRNKDEIVGLLLKHGANPSIKNKRGKTPEEMARKEK